MSLTTIHTAHIHNALTTTWECRDKAKDVVDTNTVPLPKVSYSMLKDKHIRDYLAEWDLSTTGDKSALTARHQRYGIRDHNDVFPDPLY